MQGSHGNADRGLTSARVLVAGGEPMESLSLSGFFVSGNADRGVSTRDVVTELRATHGSVRAEEE
jgi:hypothetical protein